MSESYSVEAILSARDAGFTAGMKAAQKSTESLGSILKKGIGFGAFAAAGSKAVSTVTNSITNLAQSTVGAGMNFESAMSSVSAISGATGKNLDALTAKAKKMGGNNTIYSDRIC